MGRVLTVWEGNVEEEEVGEKEQDEPVWSGKSVQDGLRDNRWGRVGPVQVADLAPGQLGPDQGLLDSDKQCEPLGICTLGCDLARSGF